MRIRKTLVFTSIYIIAALMLVLFMVHARGSVHPHGPYVEVDLRRVPTQDTDPLVQIDDDSTNLRFIYGKLISGTSTFGGPSLVVLNYNLKTHQSNIVHPRILDLPSPGWRNFTSRSYLVGGTGFAKRYRAFKFPTWAFSGNDVMALSPSIHLGECGIAQTYFKGGGEDRVIGWQFVVGDFTQLTQPASEAEVEPNDRYAILIASGGKSVYFFDLTDGGKS